MKFWVKYLVFVEKNSTFDKVDGDNKINGAKSQTNFQTKLAKSKNTMKPNFLAECQLLADASSGSGFFTFKNRLVFTKLRQVSIKALIFHYFDLKCHIHIKIDISSYVDGIFY